MLCRQIARVVHVQLANIYMGAKGPLNPKKLYETISGSLFCFIGKIHTVDVKHFLTMHAIVF